MSIPGSWTMWMAGAAAVLAVVLGAAAWKRRRHHPSPIHSYEPDTRAAGPAAGPEQRALLQAANEVRTALERQGRQMEELRTFWSRRLNELEERIGALAGERTGGRETAFDARREVDASGYAADFRTYGAEDVGWPSAAPEPAWSPGPADQPVEVRDGVLVASRSLPPAGYVSAAGPGEARVYLNADVQLTEFSLPKWAAFFDLAGARPYAAYRTRTPAQVRWDAAAGRGELIARGTVEAI